MDYYMNENGKRLESVIYWCNKTAKSEWNGIVSINKFYVRKLYVKPIQILLRL